MRTLGVYVLAAIGLGFGDYALAQHGLAWPQDPPSAKLRIQFPPEFTGVNGASMSSRAEVLFGDMSSTRARRLALMHDHYLSLPWLGAASQGGLRATGGLVFGSSSGIRGTLPWTSSDGTGDVLRGPYLGLGYSGLSTKGDWSFSADLGLVARNASTLVRFGRVASGTQGLDEFLRDLRLTPTLQLGVGYSF